MLYCTVNTMTESYAGKRSWATMHNNHKFTKNVLFLKKILSQQVNQECSTLLFTHFYKKNTKGTGVVHYPSTLTNPTW
uniref:Uncharacterized protein n=1 Tax=Anguilla anguilla TaxID=7936 RepID=A0A0E9W4F7_ANGAN